MGKVPDPAGALLDQVADLRVGDALADDLAQPVAVRIHRQRLQPRDIAGQLFDKGAELRDQDRHEQQDEQHERQNDGADDHQRGDEPVDPHALQPVGERIEQIGERHAGDERQQNFAQDPDGRDADHERQHPEGHLPRQRHPSPRLAASVAATIA